MLIRTLIVDDEPLAREGLMLLLEEEPDIEIIGQCGSGSEAMRIIAESTPDLVLMDIEMPGVDGFGVLGALTKPLPFIIFVTAYDVYAVEAFNIHAIDYLLKPVRQQRLQESLKRVRDKMHDRAIEPNDEALSAVLDMVSRMGVISPDTGRRDERIIVRSHGHVYFLQTKDIAWVEAAGDYVTIHAPGKSHLLRETMRNMETRLSPYGFSRIHRSAIINLDHVHELTVNKNNDYCVILRDGTSLNLGRSYKNALYAALGAVDTD